MPCFPKEHVISGSHPDNFFADETHLTHQKSDPSDPDCPGHPTHFQPWVMPYNMNCHKLKSKLYIAFILNYFMVAIISGFTM